MTDKTELEVTNLRDLIAEVAADLATERPYWTAGCLADALIAKGVGLTTRTPDPTPAVPDDGLVEALERIAAPAIVSLDQCPDADQPNGWRHLAVDRIDIARTALAAYRGEA